MIIFTNGDEVADWNIYVNKEDAELVRKEKYSKYDCYVASIPLTVL
jgi:hypothetical protein